MYKYYYYCVDDYPEGTDINKIIEEDIEDLEKYEAVYVNGVYMPLEQDAE